jgi:hypothetical protein
LFALTASSLRGRPFLTVVLRDGSVIAGWFASCSVKPLTLEEQEIALAADAVEGTKIAVRQPGAQSFAPITDNV